MAQKKDNALSIASRREMADLLAQNREASARIRVENIIQTDICVELMEILELYAELLLARAGLLDTVDKKAVGEGDDTGTGLDEAAASIIYAAPRLPREVRELGTVRALLVERFGKEFGVRAQENRDEIVPRRVSDKLKVEPPREALVTAYLEEIAKTYGVEWPRRRVGEDEEMVDLGKEVDDEEGDEDGVGGGMKEAPILADGQPAVTPVRKKMDLGKAYDAQELNKATPPREIGPGGAKSPISVAPPGARSDNLSPKLKLPGGEDVKKATPPAPKPQVKNPVGGTVPTVDDLARRFSALKR